MKKSLGVLLVGFMAIAACKKNNNTGSPIPSIDGLTISADSVHVNTLKDSISVSFNFNDGDGDLGNDPNGSNYDVFMKGNRPGDSVLKFFFPDIPPDAQNADIGIHGVATIALANYYLIPRDTVRARDTVHFDVLYPRPCRPRKQSSYHAGYSTSSSLDFTRKMYREGAGIYQSLRLFLELEILHLQIIEHMLYEAKMVFLRSLHAPGAGHHLTLFLIALRFKAQAVFAEQPY